MSGSFNFHSMVGPVFFVFFFWATSVTADQVSASVETTAGLAPVLTLTCTDVDFSVWRLPLRPDVNLPTTIGLSIAANKSTSPTVASLGGNTLFVAREASFTDVVAGTCTVHGSNNPNQRIRVKINNNKNLVLAGTDRGKLTRPSQDAVVKADLELKEDFVEIDSAGHGTFRVVGVMTVPTLISVDNYGGYTTTAVSAMNAAEVVVTDTLFP